MHKPKRHSDTPTRSCFFLCVVVDTAVGTNDPIPMPLEVKNAFQMACGREKKKKNSTRKLLSYIISERRRRKSLFHILLVLCRSVPGIIHQAGAVPSARTGRTVLRRNTTTLEARVRRVLRAQPRCRRAAGCGVSACVPRTFTMSWWGHNEPE